MANRSVLNPRIESFGDEYRMVFPTGELVAPDKSDDGFLCRVQRAIRALPLGLTPATDSLGYVWPNRMLALVALAKIYAAN